uniref:Uncharacterized protein n=1 Tax=Tetradesmus obliquus TaxID=3088 RepID=A0A383V8Q8_TETOB|eukprot:jgi/Sobl393_1/16275/SZX61561.1
MDIDIANDQQHTQLERAWSVVHECGAKCSVRHLFGNTFECCSSGQLHICDANCSKRVYRDRYSEVCLVSRRVFEVQQAQQEPRKRGSCGAQDLQNGKRTCTPVMQPFGAGQCCMEMEA